MRVSIVTPSYNQGRFLERTLRSVLCQTHQDLQYIVVDACSEDNTSAILESYALELHTLIREPDSGPAEALEKGFRRAEGEILAYLNADDCFASNSVLAQVVEHFDNDQTLDVLYGRRITTDGDGHFHALLPYARFAPDVLRVVDYIPQEATFWRRRLHEKGGSFIRSDLKFAYDYELWLRFQALGAKFTAIRAPLGLFRAHASQKSVAEWERGLAEINRLQREYSGTIQDEGTMRAAFAEHVYGPFPVGWIHRKLRERLCHHFGQVRRFMQYPPLDDWSRTAPIPVRHR
jgi:glycosyltransferase involved in cell wall biosynthesis